MTAQPQGSFVSGGWRMSKQQMIDEIRRHNRSAEWDFLINFSDEELTSYLRRLTEVVGHRGRASGWIRQGDTHAVVRSVA